MTVAEIREMLRRAGAGEFEALERSLAADGRKGVKAALETARRRLAAEAAERARVEGLYAFDRSFLEGGRGVVVGLDEVGRGSVAGPLAVGAVAFAFAPEPASGGLIAGLDDSKRLSPAERTAVAADVRERALAWAVEYVEPGLIDERGMAASLRLAFAGALARVEREGIRPDAVLVDGNPLGMDARERNVVKGDSKSASIAAASVVAKVERDALMRSLDSTFPQYGFSDNKGYASPEHVGAIRAYGLSPVHRVSFCKSFMQGSLF